MVPTIEGQTYNFINSGLYDGLFVLQDTETETLWNHMTGEAVYGLGIPTTRSLAVIGTGELVHREIPERGDDSLPSQSRRAY